ncbi:MAG TPA: hypothetical protein VFN50_06580 [Acidimicrobiales bacterium]|nr:hypothetical protein [Acidimicrobiales bacterium]
MPFHEIVGGAVAAGLLAVVGTWWWLRRRRRTGVEAPRELACTWRILRTDEEVRAATERALGYERARAQQVNERARRYELALEALAEDRAVSALATSVIRLTTSLPDFPGPDAA